MAIYIGYYRPTPQFLAETGARRRAGDTSPDPRMRQRVLELPDKLPASCTLLAAYAPGLMGGAVFSERGLPGVLIVETDTIADLQFISQYYEGFLAYQWAPANRIGVNRQERQASLESVATPATARA